MLVKRKIQICLAASYSLAISGTIFLLLVKSFRNFQHQEAEHQVQEGGGGAADLKQFFFLVECISGFHVDSQSSLV